LIRLDGSSASCCYDQARYAATHSAQNEHRLQRRIYHRIIESIHNYINFQQPETVRQEEQETNILRKGAISVKIDELCIVALNMRDGILLCRGKENPDIA
jgi:hypothetical protein